MYLVKFVLISLGIAALIPTSCEAQGVEDKLFDFIMNSKDVQKRYDVKCSQTSTEEFPESRGIDPSAFVRLMRYTADGSRKRRDVSISKLNSSFDEGELCGNWFAIEDAGKYWQVGQKVPSNSTDLPMLYRTDPVSMLLLTLDSQANGKGATHAAVSELFEVINYVDSFSEKDMTFGVWVSDNRKLILEVGFMKNDEMPTSIKHYFSFKGTIAKGDELNGRYKSSLKLVSESRIAWKKMKDLYVPLRASMSRGQKGGVLITQFWEFADWKLGDEVDLRRLDLDLFANSSMATEIQKLRNEISSM